MNYLILVLSLAVPPIGIPLGLYGLYQNTRKWKTYIFCISLGIAAIAYCYFPKGDPDIVRYVEYINSLTGVPLREALNSGIHGEINLYVFSFFCWLAARIHDPQIIPALSTFFVYYCGLYVTCCIGVEHNIRKSVIVTYVVFIILSLNMHSVINNVRNVFSFSIVSFAIFRDIYLKKRNLLTIFLYIFPVFIHQTALIMILIRIIFGLVSRMRIIMLAVFASLNLTIRIASQFLSGVSSNNVIVGLIKSFVYKADVYYYDVTSEWGLLAQKSLSLRAERYINIAFALVVCILIIYMNAKKIKNNKDEYSTRLKPMRDYSFMICLMTIACAPMLTPEYWRFYSIAVLFSAVPYFDIAKYGNRTMKQLSNGIFFFTLLECSIWMRFITNSDLNKLLFYPYISSPFIIVVKDLFAV